MLSCRAVVGIPTPTILWRRRDGLPLTHRAKEEYPGTIIISDITLEEAGEYECYAVNVAGEATQTTTITVSEPPSISLTPDRQELVLTEGDELKLECNAVGHPMPSVQWKRTTEDETLRSGLIPFGAEPLTTPRAVIHKYNVQIHDGGPYNCIATNSAGSDEKYIYLVVNPKRGDVGKYNIKHNNIFTVKFGANYLLLKKYMFHLLQ